MNKAVTKFLTKGFHALVAVALIAVMVGAPTLSASAQATPVPINVDTNQLMSQVNTWILALDDVIFLGVAISIAIAILLFIGKTVLTAFRGGGGS